MDKIHHFFPKCVILATRMSWFLCVILKVHSQCIISPVPSQIFKINWEDTSRKGWKAYCLKEKGHSLCKLCIHSLCICDNIYGIPPPVFIKNYFYTGYKSQSKFLPKAPSCRLFNMRIKKQTNKIKQKTRRNLSVRDSVFR